ncbi:ankyrin repeat-containing domain protein, partial [Mariannaea sp. PMI_226]
STADAIKNAVTDIKSDHHLANIDRWLSPPDHLSNFRSAKKRRCGDTGAWILDSSPYKEWKGGSRRRLWLYGLAGCGKTVLSTRVIDDLLQTDKSATVVFFFDFNDPGKQTVENLLRSLASQFYRLGDEAARRLDHLFTSYSNGRTQLDTSTLSGFVKSAIQLDKKVTIVIDALDECTTRKELLCWLRDITSTNARLLVTGRPEAEFQCEIPRFFEERSCILLDKKATNIDIHSYVTMRLKQDPDFIRMELSQRLHDEISVKVGDSADGMFRWAACQLDSLTKCLSPYDIKTALESLPRDLDETYSRMLQNIPMEYQGGAIRLLQFLVHTARPLELSEAVEVIATEITGESRGFQEERRLFQEIDVLKYCPSLISIAQVTTSVPTGTHELHLAHFSVKEYLLKQSQFSLESASVVITKTCLSYLTDIKGDDNTIQTKFPMADYAAEFWMNYAASAEISKVADIVGGIVEFLQNEVTFQRWAYLSQFGNLMSLLHSSPTSSRLYYVRLGGLVWVARSLIDKGADVNTQGGEFGNALQAASVRGYHEIVHLLLNKGANVNAQGGYYSNALQAASENGHHKVVQLLLDKGANVNAQRGYYYGNDNALQAASVKGHHKIVQLLLDKGANINAQGGLFGNALQAATATGHYKIVQLLLDKGADVNAQGGHYGDALQAATATGYYKIVQLLLDKGADVNTQGGEFGNALQAASV